MTQELKDSLERQLQAARESGDDQQVHAAMCMATIALMDCQMKTATRVKEERTDMYELKRELAAKFSEVRQANTEFQKAIEKKFDTIHSELRSMKDKGSGAMAVVKAIAKIAALGGGSVGIAGLAKALGVL